MQNLGKLISKQINPVVSKEYRVLFTSQTAFYEPIMAQNAENESASTKLNQKTKMLTKETKRVVRYRFLFQMY